MLTGVRVVPRGRWPLGGRLATPVGVLWIRPQPGKPSRFHLGLDETVFGPCHSTATATATATAFAADDVNVHSTGATAIDSLPAGSLPCDLAKWHLERYRVGASRGNPHEC